MMLDLVAMKMLMMMTTLMLIVTVLKVMVVIFVILMPLLAVLHASALLAIGFLGIQPLLGPLIWKPQKTAKHCSF